MMGHRFCLLRCRQHADGWNGAVRVGEIVEGRGKRKGGLVNEAEGNGVDMSVDKALG